MDFAMTTYKFIRNVAQSIQLLTIYKEVCEFYSERMHYESILTRQIAHYIAHRITQASSMHIGYIMGGKNYATTRGSINKIAGLIEPMRNDFVIDRKLRREISILIFKLKQSTK
jgi:chromosomal replication initiation ATPase DnaA